jgi:hypothetical protein
MKYLICIVLLISLFSCKKERFESCPEYENLIGTWVGLNGDIKSTLIVSSEGSVEVFNEYERSFSFKGDLCEVKNSGGYLLLKRNKPSSHLYFSLDYQDSIYMHAGAFNQPTSSIDQKILFIKLK